MNDESRSNVLSIRTPASIDRSPNEFWRGEIPDFDEGPFNTAAANASIVNTMRSLVLLMAKSMANFDNLVEVDVITREDSTTIVVRVDSADADILRGRNGKTLRSMNTILDAVSKKYKAHFVLEIDAR